MKIGQVAIVQYKGHRFVWLNERGLTDTYIVICDRQLSRQHLLDTSEYFEVIRDDEPPFIYMATIGMGNYELWSKYLVDGVSELIDKTSEVELHELKISE